MALSVKADETALELFRRSNRSPLRTGIAFLDEVMMNMYLSQEDANSILLEFMEDLIFPLPTLVARCAPSRVSATLYHGT